jgi:hypothetical protein
MKLLQALLVALGCAASAAWGQGGGTGLEKDESGTLEYLIEDLSPDALKRGLNGALLRARVESHLRKNDIEPKPTSLATGPYLYVLVNVTGTVFNLRVELQRPVSYVAGERTHRSYAATWQTGGIGNAPTGDYVLAALDGALATFVKQYRAANAR